MNLDERLEALTQTVEIMARMHRENEKRLAAVMDTMNRMGRIMEAHDMILDHHDH
jgi:septal ring factor EnvC (AmiA/AmiB activator)